MKLMFPSNGERTAPVLVYLANIILVAAFELAKVPLSKTNKDCSFPTLGQKLVEFFQGLSRVLRRQDGCNVWLCMERM